MVYEGSKGSIVILLFLRILCEVWLVQLSLYPSCMALFRSQNAKCKNFVNRLHDVLNVVENKSHYTNGL